MNADRRPQRLTAPVGPNRINPNPSPPALQRGETVRPAPILFPFVNDAVISAIERAVGRDPDNIELRLHLVSLLMAAGRAGDAIAHCDETLRLEPGNAAARELAASCSEVLGDAEAAAGYRAPSVAQGESAVREVADQFGEYEEAELRPPAGPALTLADVVGLDEVKAQINRMFLGPARNPDLREAFGASVGGGVLLWGPPGCGKTFVARALAGELGVSFIHVGLADVLDMWIGSSERNLRKVFEDARRQAPSLLFLDEIDALGHRRSRLTSDGIRNVVNQLLAELDGAGNRNEGVFVVGATNQPWVVDSALRRPGRFDRSILVLPPDGRARFEIMVRALSDRPVDDSIDINRVVQKTDGFSGADMVHIAESAVALALEDSIEADEVVPVTQSHLDEVLGHVAPSITEWVRSARDAALFSEDEDLYRPFLAWLEDR